MQDAPTLAPPARMRTKLATLAVSSLVCAVLGYLAFRHFSTPKLVESVYVDPTNTYQIVFYNREGSRLSTQKGGLAAVLDPFTFYANYPRQNTPHFKIDENGLRGGIADDSKPKVFLVGGSAAFGYGLDSDEQTMTGCLNREVPSHTFVNAGVVGYVSGQECVQMITRLDRFEPSGYLLLDGWNDIADSIIKRPHLGVNGEFESVGRRLAEYTIISDKVGNARESFAGGRAEPVKDDDVEGVLAVYLANLEKMNAWAGLRGAAFFVMFQPLVTDREHPTDVEAKLGRNVTLCARYRGFIADAIEFCKQNDIRYCDVGRRPEFQESTQTLFLDAVHPSAAGQAVLASIVKNEFVGDKPPGFKRGRARKNH
jgi:hypothetical protein